MSAYWKFDPYKDLDEPETVAKGAKVAKDGTGETSTLAGLATLAAPPAENENSCFRTAAWKGEADELRRPFLVVPSPTDIPTDWTAGLLGIADKPCPVMIEPKRWPQLKGDANRFVDHWGRQAAMLGWSTLDLFGCHPTHPADRYDAMGLVWMIADAEIVVIGPEVANIRNVTGSFQRIWKCPVVHGRILIWEL